MHRPVSTIRTLTLILALALVPSSAWAQRFGGQFGGAGGLWLVFVNPDVAEDRSFGRDLGGVIGLGGRGFLQTGRVRLGGGAFGGSFIDEGLNSAGNEVDGGLSAAGFTLEYLAYQQNLEVIVGGLVGGGSLTLEERLGSAGGVETLRRRRDGVFIGYPWVRVGYNLAPFANAGLQLGYLFGSRDIGGFAIGLDVLVGLIP